MWVSGGDVRALVTSTQVCRLRLIVAATTVVSSLAVSVFAQITAFTEEAIARGVVYTPASNVGVMSGVPVGFADLDGDGDQDLIAAGATADGIGIFDNDGTGHFTDRSSTSGIPPILKASNYSAADYDGDGDLDLVIGRFGGGIHLFRNEGNFTFVDVTAASGLTEFAATHGLSWGDLDGDGWIDLHVCNYVNAIPGTNNARNRVWRNNGDGTFSNVAQAWGLDTKAYSFLTAITDFDEDGDLDIYLSNDRGMYSPFVPNRYWRNDGGTFSEIGQQNGTGVALFSMGVAVGDLDRDGRIDLYCTNLPAAVPPLNGENPLLLQLTRGAWTQSQQAWGVTVKQSGWASLFFDADLDGWQDLFVVNQHVTNRLFLNTGGPPMFDATTAAGLSGPLNNAYSASVADIDGDGDLDLAVSHAGINLKLYINHSDNRRRWAMFNLRGERKDTAAIGATVRVRTGAVEQIRQVVVGANGYLGGSDGRLHFGLGAAVIMDEIHIRWPNSKRSRTLTNYPVDRVWTLYTPPELGDANGDAVIDQSDLSVFSANFAAPVKPGLEMMDMNGDGVLDQADFLLLLGVMNGLLGDFNLDGVVSGADLAHILGSWGQSGTAHDLNMDGTIDGQDLAILLENWG